MNFDHEQSEIYKTVNYVLKGSLGTKWSNFKGDSISRIVKRYLEEHLPEGYKIVGPDVFVAGNPVEFDLLIVNSGSKPLPFTCAYPTEHVRRVIEVKRIGPIVKRKEFPVKIEKIRKDFDTVARVSGIERTGIKTDKVQQPNFKGAYLAISETINPSKATSIKYGIITKETMEPYGAFILFDRAEKKLVQGEWERFVNYITSGL
ncbi:MAG: hypothetical protein JW712_11545 [Dehalococcoidales bacterium]|nr:hypothetical protein [Dehalococcoidales bacterium]